MCEADSLAKSFKLSAKLLTATLNRMDGWIDKWTSRPETCKIDKVDSQNISLTSKYPWQQLKLMYAMVQSDQIWDWNASKPEVTQG